MKKVISLIVCSIILLCGCTTKQNKLHTILDHLDKGDYNQNIKAAEIMIEIDPKNPVAYVLRGEAYHMLGEYDKAIDDLNIAIELDPKYGRAYAYRGETYRLKKEYSKAMMDLNKAIELNPEDSWAYANRGVIYRLAGREDKAIRDLNKAIELSPNYSWAYSERAEIYLKKKNTTKQSRIWTRFWNLILTTRMRSQKEKKLTSQWRNRNVLFPHASPKGCPFKQPL